MKLTSEQRAAIKKYVDDGEKLELLFDYLNVVLEDAVSDAYNEGYDDGYFGPSSWK